MTHSDVWYAIDNFASLHNMSCSGLAKYSGLDPTTFNKSKRWSKYGQPRWPSTNSIAKILNATGCSLNDFIKYFAPNAKQPGLHQYHNDKKTPSYDGVFIYSGRGDTIRTCDILLPKQALYQTELRPETKPIITTFF